MDDWTHRSLEPTLARHEHRRRRGSGVVSVIVTSAPSALGWSTRAIVTASADAPPEEAWTRWTAALRSAAREAAIEVVARATERSTEEVRSLLAHGAAEARSMIARASEALEPSLGRTLVAVLDEGVSLTLDAAGALASLDVALPWLLFVEPTDAQVAWALRAVEIAPALPIAIALRPERLASIERELTRSLVDRLRAGLIEGAHATRPIDDALRTAVGTHTDALSSAELAPTWRRALAALQEERHDEARSLAERLLFEALEALPETRALFRLNERIDGVRFGASDVEIDLCATSLRLAVEVDGPFHFVDADAYRRDRRKDVLLQRHGFLVTRSLASDVIERLGEVLDTILDNVRHARATRRLDFER